jgi:hypothetical protein
MGNYSVCDIQNLSPVALCVAGDVRNPSEALLDWRELLQSVMFLQRTRKSACPRTEP